MFEFQVRLIEAIWRWGHIQTSIYDTGIRLNWRHNWCQRNKICLIEAIFKIKNNEKMNWTSKIQPIRFNFKGMCNFFSTRRSSILENYEI